MISSTLSTRCREIFTQQAGEQEEKRDKNNERSEQSDNIGRGSDKCRLRVVYLSHFRFKDAGFNFKCILHTNRAYIMIIHSPKQHFPQLQLQLSLWLHLQLHLTWQLENAVEECAGIIKCVKRNRCTLSTLPARARNKLHAAVYALCCLQSSGLSTLRTSVASAGAAVVL